VTLGHVGSPSGACRLPFSGSPNRRLLRRWVVRRWRRAGEWSRLRWTLSPSAPGSSSGRVHVVARCGEGCCGRAADPGWV